MPEETMQVEPGAPALQVDFKIHVERKKARLALLHMIASGRYTAREIEMLATAYQKVAV